MFQSQDIYFGNKLLISELIAAANHVVAGDLHDGGDPAGSAV
jgi:hypothetical protein